MLVQVVFNQSPASEGIKTESTISLSAPPMFNQSPASEGIKTLS